MTGRNYFLANYVYIYSLYARTMIFFYWSAFRVHSNSAPGPETQSRRLCAAEAQTATAGDDVGSDET